MSDKRKVAWSIPRWAFVPRQWKSLRREILNARSLRNILIGSTLACVLVLVAFKVAFPALVVPNLWPVVIAIPGIVVAMCLQVVLLAVVPPYVSVRPDRLQKSHGQSGLQIKPSEVIASHIYVHRDDRVRLKIRYLRRDRSRTLVLGVAPTVDLDQLVTMLPVVPRVWDARSRQISYDRRTRRIPAT